MTEHTPDGWEIHDDWWFRYQEQLSPKAWLLCFTLRGPSPDRNTAGWVMVTDRRWTNEGQSHTWLEDNKLEEPCGFLEVTCMMHEMREKYKSP